MTAFISRRVNEIWLHVQNNQRPNPTRGQNSSIKSQQSSDNSEKVTRNIRFRAISPCIIWSRKVLLKVASRFYCSDIYKITKSVKQSLSSTHKIHHHHSQVLIMKYYVSTVFCYFFFHHLYLHFYNWTNSLTYTRVSSLE